MPNGTDLELLPADSVACAKLGTMLFFDQRRVSVLRDSWGRGGRVVDRAALEMRSTCKRTGGSNPSLSATLC